MRGVSGAERARRNAEPRCGTGKAITLAKTRMLSTRPMRHPIIKQRRRVCVVFPRITKNYRMDHLLTEPRGCAEIPFRSRCEDGKVGGVACPLLANPRS